MSWDSVLEIGSKVIGGLIAFFLYLTGRKSAETEIEKQQAEKALEQLLNAQKAQEQIRRNSDEIKKKIPNSWDRIGIKPLASRVRKTNKS